jgi:hypothetical protein
MPFTSTLGTRESLPGNLVLGWTRSIKVSASSELQLSHNLTHRTRCITAFDQVITLLGLHRDSQGEDALVLALLQYAAPNSERRDYRFVSPFDEVLSRLEATGASANAVKYLRTYFNTADDQYRRRPR